MESKIRVRVSDSVLDDDCWPVYELTFYNSKVIEQKELSQGAYSAGQFIGITIDDLAEWTQYDATGSHPETYHEVWNPFIDKWEDFIASELILGILKLNVSVLAMAARKQ